MFSLPTNARRRFVSEANIQGQIDATGDGHGFYGPSSAALRSAVQANQSVIRHGGKVRDKLLALPEALSAWLASSQQVRAALNELLAGSSDSRRKA